MQIIDSPLGKLGIQVNDGYITQLDILQQDNTTQTGFCHRTPPTDIQQALSTYFSHPDYQFDLPLQPQGTEFQQKVWRALCEIPCGTTLTYGQLAKKLNTSPRAIGQACRKNPIPIIIPCHRITGANHPGGFMGETSGAALKIKNWLLAHEKSVII